MTDVIPGSSGGPNRSRALEDGGDEMSDLELVLRAAKGGRDAISWTLDAFPAALRLLKKHIWHTQECAWQIGAKCDCGYHDLQKLLSEAKP